MERPILPETKRDRLHNPYAPNMGTRILDWIKRHPKWSAAIAVFLIVAAIAGGNGGSGNTPSPAAADPTSSTTPTSAAPAPPRTPAQQLQGAVGSAANGVQVSKLAGGYAVKFQIKDNLSNGMIRDGIAIDVFKMLQAAASNGPAGNYGLYFQGTFAMQDKYGKAITPDPVVFRSMFKSSTARRISYDNVNTASYDTIGSLADGFTYLHPAFQ